MILHCTSEKYSPGGSVVGNTIVRAVRNASLDEWAVLLRETLQNSVDARLSDRRPIHFYVSLDEATADQRACLGEDLFADIPPQVKSLRTAIGRRGLPLLIIADWETWGLGGPTRAAWRRTSVRTFATSSSTSEGRRRNAIRVARSVWAAEFSSTLVITALLSRSLGQRLVAVLLCA